MSLMPSMVNCAWRPPAPAVDGLLEQRCVFLLGQEPSEQVGDLGFGPVGAELERFVVSLDHLEDQISFA